MRISTHATVTVADSTEVRDLEDFTSVRLGQYDGGEQPFSVHVTGTPAEREAFLRRLGQQLLEASSELRLQNVAAKRALQAVR